MTAPTLQPGMDLENVRQVRAYMNKFVIASRTWYGRRVYTAKTYFIVNVLNHLVRDNSSRNTVLAQINSYVGKKRGDQTVLPQKFTNGQMDHIAKLIVEVNTISPRNII